MSTIDSEKIIENMKAVLKATKKSKSRKKKRHKKSDNNNTEDDDKSSSDEAIADLMTKTWKMKSPIIDQKIQKSPPKVKVNAFEKLMNHSKKIELTSLEVQLDGSQKKQKRKYTKRKIKPQEGEPDKIDPESDLSMLDEESLIQLSKRRSGTNTTPSSKTSPTLNGIQKFFNVKQNESLSLNTTQIINQEIENDDEDIKVTRKRNRGKDNTVSVPVENTPKRRRKTKEENILLDTNENVEEIDSSQSIRPKRSCANKINYSFLESPDKPSPGKKKIRRRRIASSDEDSSFAVIEIDENSPVLEKKNVKLAPVFVKKLPKPAIDPAVREARRNFLFSNELPSNLRATIDKQKQLDDEILSNDLVAFPTISHITQSTSEHNHYENLVNSKFKFREELNDDCECTLEPLVFGCFTDCLNEVPEKIETVSYDHASPENIKQIVSKIKDTSGSFPVNRLFKQLLRKHKDAALDSSDISFQNSSFIDIYKPTSSDEFLLLRQPIEELKKFLTTWNDRNSKFDDYDSDSNSRSSFKGLMCNNYVVLSGNNGVGKTSSVYALANDLNYEVIEINAGSRRSGKKMLQDLYEATQSHRVEKRTEDSNSEQLQSDTSLDRRTIILIEDAEIAFDSDDGFISSIQQLINITKRPVILTTNNRECPHLQRFIQYNEIIYTSPQSITATKYLTLLSLATASTYQHRRIDETEIERLYSLNECDLRKTINEIEFFVRTDGNSKRGGNLLEIYGNHHQSRNKKPSVSGRKNLARRCFESSIISSYSHMISTFEMHEEKEELSHHSSNLISEMTYYFEHSATEFYGGFERGGLKREIKVKR